MQANNSLNQTRPRFLLGDSQTQVALIHCAARIRARRLAQKGWTAQNLHNQQIMYEYPDYIDFGERDLFVSDVLLIHRIPSKESYVQECLKYFEEEKIGHGLPTISDDQSITSWPPLLWARSLGLCSLETPHSIWRSREPFVKLGASTNYIEFRQLDLLAPASSVSPELVQWFESHENKPAPYESNGGLAHRLLSPDDEQKWLIEHTFRQNQHRQDKIGFFCFINRFSCLSGFSTGNEELLSWVVFQRLSKFLAPSGEIRFIEVP